MNCSCAICCGRLESSDDIFTTKCGHVFHFPCLSQWLERSHTCPQCRERTNVTKIHRLYFNISNNDNIKEDAAALQERIDNLQYQILLRDKDVTHFKSKAELLHTQATALRSGVRKLESEIEHKNTAIHALKEQAKYYKQSHDDSQKHKQEVVELKKKINDYKDLQILLNSDNDGVDDMISHIEDVGKLTTYVSVLKKELTNGLKRCKEYRVLIRKLKQDLNDTKLENNKLQDSIKKMKTMEETIVRLEMENSTLMKRLENNLNSESHNESNLNATLTSEPVKSLEKKIFSSHLTIPLSQNNLSDENEENSPTNRHFKIQNLMSDHKRKIARLKPGSAISSSSILAKKPRLAHDPMALTGPRDATYTSDGLGGFTKVEYFPEPTGIVKKKVVKMRETNKLMNQNKIDNFIDLTQEIVSDKC